MNRFSRVKNELEPNDTLPKVTTLPTKKVKENKKNSAFMLTPTEKENLKMLAEMSGKSMSGLISFWIEESMKQLEEE